MAILIVQGADFTERLNSFSIRCKRCNSTNVTLEIDWGGYPSCTWRLITLVCNDCLHEETIDEAFN